MKWVSPLFSDARNKIGGTIYARNRAGVYQRARVTPANPQTAFQQANRAMFKTIVSTWRTLTPAQRLSWNDEAGNVTLTDSLGQTSRPSGFQLYTSRNRNLLLCGAAAITTPLPSTGVFDRGFATEPPDIESNGTLMATDGFFNNQGSLREFYVLIKQTPPLSPGITFVAPWLYRTLFTDDSADGPWDITAQWTAQFGGPLTVGEQVGSKILWIDQNSGAEVYAEAFLTVAVRA